MLPLVKFKRVTTDFTDHTDLFRPFIRVIGVIRGCVLFCPLEILALCVLPNTVRQPAGAVSQKPVDAPERVRRVEQLAMGRSGPIADQQLICALGSPALLFSKESHASGRIQPSTHTAFPCPEFSWLRGLEQQSSGIESA